MSNISITLVRFSDGSVDEDATLAVCQEAISRYVVANAESSAKLGKAIHAVFDVLNGHRAPMPYVIARAVDTLAPGPENHNEVTKAVGDYIRSHSGERGTAEFCISKGKGGGVCRWSDQSETK